MFQKGKRSRLLRNLLKTTSIALAAVLWSLLGFAAHALADVTGSFSVDTLLLPEGVQTESVKFLIDLRTNLQVNVTVSGLVLGVESLFGTTGIEFVVLQLTTAFGAVSITDQVVFATPFFTSASGTSPTVDGAGNPNGAGFVKKRVTTTWNVAGVVISNLALFEDVDFPQPASNNAVYHLGFVDAVPHNQTPTFGFGDVITLSAQTQAGIRLTSTTGLCATPAANAIKGRSFPRSVNPGCLGHADRPLLAFDFETLSIQNVKLGDLTLNASAVFRPLRPTSGTLVAVLPLANLGRLVTVFQSEQLTDVRQLVTAVTLRAKNLFITLIDADSDVDIDTVSAALSVTLNASRAPAVLSLAASVARGQGLTSLSATLSTAVQGVSFSTSTNFSGDGGLSWQATTFSLALAQPLNVNANLNFTPSGLSGVGFSLGAAF